MPAVAADSRSRRGSPRSYPEALLLASHSFRVAQAAAGIRETNGSGGLPFSLAPPGGQAETAQAQQCPGEIRWTPERVFRLLETIWEGDEEGVDRGHFPTLPRHKRKLLLLFLEKI